MDRKKKKTNWIEEQAKSFFEAKEYFRENGDLFTQKQLDFLMKVEYLRGMTIANSTQVEAYITMVNVVRDHEDTLKKRYREQNK